MPVTLTDAGRRPRPPLVHRLARTLAAATVAGGVLLATGGCAESRRAAYEEVLRGEISSARGGRTPGTVDRFSGAFPERQELQLAGVDDFD